LNGTNKRYKQEIVCLGGEGERAPEKQTKQHTTREASGSCTPQVVAVLRLDSSGLWLHDLIYLLKLAIVKYSYVTSHSHNYTISVTLPHNFGDPS